MSRWIQERIGRLVDNIIFAATLAGATAVGAAIKEWAVRNIFIVSMSVFIIAIVAARVVWLVWIKPRRREKPARFAAGRYHYSLTLNGVAVVIDNVEESLERVSITGTVDKRPAAAVLLQVGTSIAILPPKGQNDEG